MNELEIQPGQAYITKNDKTAFILWKFDDESVGGFVSGQDADFYDWDHTVSVVHESLDLVEEAKIQLKNQEKFEYWGEECISRFDAHDGGILWACTIQWARLMEKNIKAEEKINSQILAKEAGLHDHPDGELAITILYQCWKWGDVLMNYKSYRPYCTA